MDLRIFTEPQEGATYDTLIAVARTAEAAGFDAFFRSDHYLGITTDGRPGSTDAWVTLGGLARETTRLRLGTLVTPVTFRLPGPLAISVAQVDAMSGGRVELGLGTGWYDAEHAAYGIPFPPIAERFAMLEEQLEIVTGLWATSPGDRFTFTGRHYTLTDSPALPKPVQRPRPPIVMGGWGTKRTPALAARFADEFNVPFPARPADARTAFGLVRQACEQAGREPIRLSVALTTCCGRTTAEVRRRAQAIGHDPAHILAGTPAQLVERLGEYAAVGASRAYLQILDLSDLAHLELIAAEVMPHL